MSAYLMLHGIGPVPPHIEEVEKPYWVREDVFMQVLACARHTPVRLTFDDGNSTDISIVLPALIKAGLKASFFILLDRIGKPGYLSENDIRALHAAGMDIGTHGCAHLRWTEHSDSEITKDVSRSVEQLSAIIRAPVRNVAIPYGACDRRVLGVLRKLGAARVYSSFRGANSDRSWLVRRECVMAHMGPDDVRHLITRKPALTETTLNFLKVWRRAGNAAVWAA